MGVSVQNSAWRTNYLFPEGNATKIIRRVILYNGIGFNWLLETHFPAIFLNRKG